MTGFTLTVLLLILALFGTAGLTLHTLWSLEGWWFVSSCALSAAIAGIGVYALPEWWGLFMRDLKR